MDKPKPRPARWRGSRKILSHETLAAGGCEAQGALFAPPGAELPGTSYRYSCSHCGFLWAQAKCFVPETCIQCGHEAVYLGMKQAGPAESKAAGLNEAINLPAWMESPKGRTWDEEPTRRAHTNDPFDDYDSDEDIPFPE